MRVTKTGAKRTNEKIGIPKKSIERQFQLALDRGYRHGQTKGQLNKWVTSVSLAKKYPTSCIVYNNHLFVTNNYETLITVLKVPTNLSKNINSYIKSES